MVEQVNMSFQNGSVHLNGHHHDHSNTKTKVAEDSSMLGQSYRQIFKSRALYPMLIIASVQAATLVFDKLHVQAFFHDVAMEIPSAVDTCTVCLTLVAAALTYLAYYFVFVPGPVLMLDFSCFKPDDCTRVSKRTYVEKAKRAGFFTEKSVDFQEKVLALSGLGDETYAPPSTLLEPVDRSLKASHSEAQTCIFGVADEIFSQGIVKPRDVSILVLNCSMYSPVPSLAAMVVNKYKMRKDIEVFNLGGMGCSAGLIAVDLAAKLLQGRRNSYALVISTEIISAQFGYPGNQRSMMVGNCLFRTGASGVLLSNRRGNPILPLNHWTHTSETQRPDLNPVNAQSQTT
jgi:3-ketoacyl-CoA synthase